jgi:hypothetical protein
MIGRPTNGPQNGLRCNEPSETGQVDYRRPADDARPSAGEICAGARQVGAGRLKPVQFDYAAAVDAASMLLAMLRQLFFNDRK